MRRVKLVVSTEIEVPLNRGGEEYFSEDVITLSDFRGNDIGELSKSISLHLSSGDLTDAEDNGFYGLRHNVKEKELLSKIADAGDRFTDEVDGVDFEEYARNVTSLTGLPVSDVKETGEMIGRELENMDETIEAQTPGGDLSVYDEITNNGRNFVLTPEGRSLGVIAPSNHPAVNVLWASALGMKYPTLVKPSKDEPLTTHRMTKALYESGMPENSLYFMPGDREFGDKLIEETDKGIVFGGEKIEEKYEGTQDVKTFGPGNSKIYIDEDYLDDDVTLQTALDSMMRDGGRGCINISQVVVDSDGSDAKRFAEELADEIRDVEIKDPYDEDAVVPADGDGSSERLDGYINSNLGVAEDLVHNDPDERLVEKDGAKFLRPTVVYAEDGDENPLFTELPFQYSAVAPYSEGALDNTLTLTMFTDDESKVEEAILNPSIKKVYSGVPTNDIDLKEPHEGYLVDHLYEKKALRTTNDNSFFSWARSLLG